jgi:hypothetical protein
VHEGASLWNRGNVVLGFYGQYHNPTNDRRTSSCDIGLVVSHDALHFKEPVPDFKLVPSYEEIDEAEPRLLQGTGFENVGDRTFFWYSIWVAADPKGPTGVRLATWTRDRFGYFAPAPPWHYQTGRSVGAIVGPHFISAPIRVASEGARVYVNADGLSAESHLRIEILTEQLVPVAGLSSVDSIPITESGLRRPAAWRGKESLGRLGPADPNPGQLGRGAPGGCACLRCLCPIAPTTSASTQLCPNVLRFAVQTENPCGSVLMGAPVARMSVGSFRGSNREPDVVAGREMGHRHLVPHRDPHHVQRKVDRVTRINALVIVSDRNPERAVEELVGQRHHVEGTRRSRVGDARELL